MFEMSVTLVFRGVNRFPGKLIVGLPTTIGVDQVECAVSIQGLNRPEFKFYGGDPFQALMLAIGNLKTQIAIFIRDGGRVLVVGEDGEECDLAAIVPLLGP